MPTRSRLTTWSLICFVLGSLLLVVQPVLSQSSSPQAVIIEIDDTITPPMASYVDRAINGAQDNADVIVLRIDTPGGLSTAMDDIVTSILESNVPVIAYVAPGNARAASAGVYITYAAHVAAMAPSTNIGSASPVAGDGSEMTDTMERKVINDAVSRIEYLAELRGRNAEWAAAAVRDAENITASRALELGVIDLIAPDMAALLRETDGMTVTMHDGQEDTITSADAITETRGMNAIESLLQLISNPTIAYLLMSFGSLGIFLELSNPGTFIPGIIGVVCLILGFYALGTLPVNWTGVLLIGLAFALFFIDLFVSSFGLLLVGGITSFVIGSYMLIDQSVPGYEGVSRPVIWTATALVLASAAIIGTLALRTLRSKPKSGKTALIGQTGTVRSALAPTGMVYVDGEYWTATAIDLGSGEKLPVGSKIEVVSVDGLRLTVRATARNTQAPAETRLAGA